MRWSRSFTSCARRMEKNVSKITVPSGQSLVVERNKFIKENYHSPKHPIVLCHGFSGFDRLALIPRLKCDFAGKSKSELNEDIIQKPSKAILEFEYWRDIQTALELLGTRVLIAKVPAFGDIKSRAVSLDHYITKQCQIIQNIQKNKEPVKVNLVSHSMGGLDSRYLISKIHQNSKSYKVMSLTTISTPHHGSECADFVVKIVEDNPVLKSLCPSSIFDMTTKSMKRFNAIVLDDPSVKYFSYGARFNPRWYNFFNLTWQIIKYQIKSKNNNLGSSQDLSELFDNDGLVTVKSSMWGEYMGTFNEVDHLDLINWTNQARGYFDRIMFAKEPSFDAIKLYIDICNNLAKRGL